MFLCTMAGVIPAADLVMYVQLLKEITSNSQGAGYFTWGVWGRCAGYFTWGVWGSQVLYMNLDIHQPL
jgi:hypothetical protein